jgi:gamma-glutamyltranspeptidase/glutathione hydrolase
MGPGALYAGPLGQALVDHMAHSEGLVDAEDLASYRIVDREPVRGHYRGFEILGPPPPASAGVHIVQMLNLLEAYDIAGLGASSCPAARPVGRLDRGAFRRRIRRYNPCYRCGQPG